MAICKLCKNETDLIKKSHIIPEFLYKELYDRSHRMRKFDAIAKAKGIEKVSKPPTGEYEGGLLCRECDGERLGKYESYLGKILVNSDMPEEQKLHCERIVNETGVEFLKIENIDYRLLKLSLLTILWRSGISSRQTYKEVSLGPYEEKIREQLFEEEPSSDSDIPIVIMSWRNDSELATDVIAQPIKHRKNGKTYYSIILNGYIILYFVSENSIDENLNFFRLKEDNTLSIVHLPRGTGMDFLMNYTGVKNEIQKRK
ncbi:hypothetical protein PbJCM13498_24850 [Prolixibacter bellariivorans]|uniref:HNH endonuclease 5 domain-containing protein n=1 Tax=Prolixibacter bellariivorans TaxID=314319 RepID=A0A5M4B0D9_9BACT|nr:hypothetical protein [Prolixibacter bellariivorans]GET33622.1 hypothetical protein PbJCM13498_24850 [Prolixibacter bellariivorans]